MELSLLGSARASLPILAASTLILLSTRAEGQQVSDADYRDLRQTVQARKALMEDPQLESLNVGVKVIGGIAVLWGPVPTPELSLRAERRLRAMFEFVDVRNRLSIEPDEDGAAPVQRVPDMPKFLPQQLPSAIPNDPRRPVVAPRRSVDLAGIITPEEAFIARSSPLVHGNASHPAAVHIPFTGSILWPR